MNCLLTLSPTRSQSFVVGRVKTSMDRDYQAVCRAGLERTFSERYLLSSQLRNLKLNEKMSQRSVHAGVYYIPMLSAVIGSRHYLYNTQWRGLAELLISIEW